MNLKQDFFSMYESSGSQFFRTTTGIQSGPAFNESRFVNDPFNHLGSYRNIKFQISSRRKNG